MKKVIGIVFAILMLVAIIVGCAPKMVVEAAPPGTPSMFVCVEEDAACSIVYHRDTKVMYAVSAGYYNAGTFTVLLNADGTPQVWGGAQAGGGGR